MSHRTATLTARPSSAVHSADVTMTTDLPVADLPVVNLPGTAICRPTGRPERRMPRGGRPQIEVYRRRRWIGMACVGGVLAGMVWLLVLVGANMQAASGSATEPAATTVVYVRSGESLTALAQRIAPDLPAEGVIALVRELNGLQTSGLSVGQALVVPDYR